MASTSNFPLSPLKGQPRTGCPFAFMGRGLRPDGVVEAWREGWGWGPMCGKLAGGRIFSWKSVVWLGKKGYLCGCLVTLIINLTFFIMKAIKFLTVALAMAFGMSANAQLLKDGHFRANLNLGGITWNGGGGDGAFGLGVGYQADVYQGSWLTLAWDVAQFEWNAPFNSPGDFDWLNFKTGARAFSPTFAGDHLRAYTNLDLGYVLGITAVDGTDTWHAFGLTWGLGVQLNKKWSFGYSLLYESNSKAKKHFFTLAYDF